MVARGKIALLLSLFGLVFLPYCVHVAAAEDEENPADEEAEADAGADEDGEKPANPEDFLSGAKELQDKLGQLQELLKAKGGSADPDLNSKLAGLQSQLSSLGVSLGLEGMENPVSGDGFEPGSQELQAFVSGCVALSMRRKGVKSPSTTGAMRRLAAGITKEQGKDIELVRMIGTCIASLSDTEYDLYKAGKLMSLPKAIETKSKTSEGREALMSMEDTIWQELQTVSKLLVKEMGEDQDSTGRGSGSTASNLGLLALVPIIGAAALLTKKFLDVQKEQEAKAANKKARKQK